MVRGERAFERRGGKGIDRHGVRGSKDNQSDPPEPEEDPYRDLRDTEEDQNDPVDDEYIWPCVEEEEDD